MPNENENENQEQGLQPKTVDSTSDDRVINNVMRHQYRVLDEKDKENMQGVKDLGKQFYEFLHFVGKTDPSEPNFSSRELALAATKIEEAVMWAVKHITK